MNAIARVWLNDIDSSAPPCSRTTAWRVSKRGWYCPGYHQKKPLPPPNPSAWDQAQANDVVGWVYWRHFRAWWPHRDDLCQEGLLKLWETSGVSTARGWQWKTAKNAMRDYCSRLKAKHETVSDLTSLFGEENEISEFTTENELERGRCPAKN